MNRKEFVLSGLYKMRYGLLLMGGLLAWFIFECIRNNSGVILSGIQAYGLLLLFFFVIGIIHVLGQYLYARLSDNGKNFLDALSHSSKVFFAFFFGIIANHSFQVDKVVPLVISLLGLSWAMVQVFRAFRRPRS
jgi:hypothetical protein